MLKSEVNGTTISCFMQRRIWHGRCSNPSAQYPLGREAKELVEEARRTIAGALGCQPLALHFTSCGTESDNWAIRAAAWQGRHTGRHIITTAVEHSAVLEPCRQLEQEGYEVTYLKPDRTGPISAGQVAEALRTIGVRLVDHIVVADRDFVSMADSGDLLG